MARTSPTPGTLEGAGMITFPVPPPLLNPATARLRAGMRG